MTIPEALIAFGFHETQIPFSWRLADDSFVACECVDGTNQTILVTVWRQTEGTMATRLKHVGQARTGDELAELLRGLLKITPNPAHPVT